VFLFFGQRFVVDSEVFSNVVFDRVRGDPKRMMPNPLDVGFAALGNNAAVPLLATELAKYPNYPGALHDARRLVDLHGDDFWGGSLYTTWLARLRGLSIAGGDPTSAAGLPAVMKTERGRVACSTRSSRRGPSCATTRCSTPSSRTPRSRCATSRTRTWNPVPRAWAGIVELARLGQAVAAALPPNSVSGLASYFAQVETVARRWVRWRRRTQRPAAHHAQLAFINQAVEEVDMSGGCASIKVPNGWYRSSSYQGRRAEADPTIADVHTDRRTRRCCTSRTGLPRLIT
jgi:hypothetical protein